jgi:hypothetical protein
VSSERGRRTEGSHAGDLAISFAEPSGLTRWTGAVVEQPPWCASRVGTPPVVVGAEAQVGEDGPAVCWTLSGDLQAPGGYSERWILRTDLYGGTGCNTLVSHFPYSPARRRP